MRVSPRQGLSCLPYGSRRSSENNGVTAPEHSPEHNDGYGEFSENSPFIEMLFCCADVIIKTDYSDYVPVSQAFPALPMPTIPGLHFAKRARFLKRLIILTTGPDSA